MRRGQDAGARLGTGGAEVEVGFAGVGDGAVVEGVVAEVLGEGAVEEAEVLALVAGEVGGVGADGDDFGGDGGDVVLWRLWR